MQRLDHRLAELGGSSGREPGGLRDAEPEIADEAGCAHREADDSKDDSVVFERFHVGGYARCSTTGCEARGFP